MARLNANAHSLGSLSGLDQQPMQYHIVFKRLFVLPYICHIACLFVLPKLYFFYICHTFFPHVLLPTSIIQNEIMMGILFFPKELFFFDCVDICPSVQGYLLDGLFLFDCVFFFLSFSFSLCISLWLCWYMPQRARISARWTFFRLWAKNLMESLVGLHQIWHPAPIFFSWTKVNIQIGLKI